MQKHIIEAIGKAPYLQVFLHRKKEEKLISFVHTVKP